MNHSFYLNAEEEARYQLLLSRERSRSESAFIRNRIFRKRERYAIDASLLDLKFLGQLSNLVSLIRDNLERNAGISEELSELQKTIDERINDI